MYHIIDIMWLFAFYGMRQRKDMENRCSSLKRGDIIISPQRMKFINHGILFVTEEGKSDSLDEDRILLAGIDRKSTRQNSSHVSISYAVCCLKKKNRGKRPKVVQHRITCQ